jgi:hypothetical protein
MKTIILTAILLVQIKGFTQITSPQIKAAFGVDGDLRSHYFNGFVQLGNDDWFNQRTSTADTGRFIIDTSGAAAILQRYNTTPSSRSLPFYRNMRYPQYTVVNNRLLMDAIMIRDYHGDDSTVFASGSNKNGDNPSDWQCPVSQGIPDKNDILDMFLHIRRAGPNTTDSLWMFGGMSLDNTTGNRYFDFEMYQTDIYYDRASRHFYNYGPDAGHTRWQLDASGNVLVPGDIIFNASYQSSSLTAIEARIWVHVSALSITPAQFSWTGQFDGAYNGAQYGYASIVPKSSGTYYTGLQCGNNTWGGPFGIVLQNNVLATNYAGGQFVEFSVNLTKLGLDPVNLMGGNVCGMPFRRMLVKTRASSSFTAELKDFVGPFDLFLAPRVKVQTGTPALCDTGSIAQISITNPTPSGVYQWYTNNGRILGATNGTSIVVDTPGVYMVNQYLQAGCSIYASDTIAIASLGACYILNTQLYDFKGTITANRTRLSWKLNNGTSDYFDIERSFDGSHFEPVGRLATWNPGVQNDFSYYDDITDINKRNIYYRIKFRYAVDQDAYSQIIKLYIPPTHNELTVAPNPVQNATQIKFDARMNEKITVQLLSPGGATLRSFPVYVQKGENTVMLSSLGTYPRGIYQLVVFTADGIMNRKLMLVGDRVK